MKKNRVLIPASAGKRYRRRVSSLKSVLPVRLIVFVILAAFALSGCASGPIGGAQPQVKDGVLTNGGLALDFGDNSIDSDTQTTVTVVTPDEDDAPEGLASDLYELNMEDVYEEPVTVTLKYDGQAPVDDDEAVLMLGLGSTYEMDEGGTETLYRYIPAELEDGTVTATFTPADYAELSIHGDANTGSSAPYKERTRFGLFWVSTTYIDGGHFTVYMPLKAHTFFLDYNDRRALLDDLEKVYSDYLGKGYTYSKRSEWPMEVTIKSLDALGYYSYGWSGAEGCIYLDRNLFKDGYKSGALDPLLAHEFFHFVQLNYVDVGDDLLWFDEATSTYFESTKMSNAIPNIVSEYREQIFTGVFPEDNTAANGYARMPLIRFLAGRLGEEFILNAYTTAGEGADWDSTLLSSAGPPSGWAADFYQALVGGDVSDYAPYTVHKNLVEGTAKGLGTTVALVMPEADEIAQLQEDGEPVVLGETTLNVGAYGAQLVALTVDADNLKKLPDGTDPIVKVGGGADLRAFAILGSKVQTVTDAGGGIPLNDFKKATDSKYVFLALVTNLTDSASDFELSVEIEPFPTLDELVGTYEGSTTYTEVFISDAVREEAANAASESQDTGDDENDLGCDFNLDIIAALDALEGQTQAGQLVIEKTGENTGTLQIMTVDEDGETSTQNPISFTYEKGILTFNFSQDAASLTGQLNASYGKNKDIVIDGELTLTLVADNLWLKMKITGSKPMDTV